MEPEGKNNSRKVLCVIRHPKRKQTIKNQTPASLKPGKYYSLKRFDYLEQLSMLATRKKDSVARLTRNSKLFKTIIHAIQLKKGENIVSLDLRKIPEAVTDFFIICQASSTTQVKAISDFVEAQVRKECEENAFRHEGQQAAQWVLVDYINIVVHVMLAETRKFYKLEDMWSDAQLVEHNS